jgi:hypothetical protein
VAYRRELDQELCGLWGWFQRWKTGEVDCFELSDKIHEFHDGISRQLFVMYGQLKPDIAVGRAVARDLLAAKELPPAILTEVEGKIELFRSEMENR